MVKNAKIWGDIKKDLKALSFLSVAASKGTGASSAWVPGFQGTHRFYKNGSWNTSIFETTDELTL